MLVQRANPERTLSLVDDFSFYRLKGEYGLGRFVFVVFPEVAVKAMRVGEVDESSEEYEDNKHGAAQHQRRHLVFCRLLVHRPRQLRSR